MSIRKLLAFAALAVCVSVSASGQDEGRVGFGRGSQFFGLSADYSPVSGEVWGYTTHTQFTSVAVQYGVNLTHRPRTRIRYTPELVPFATLYEGTPSQTNVAAPIREYATGARPVGFEIGMRRGSRLQPFADTHEGFLYYNRRVLSPGGSQFMFTLAFGGGVRLFASARNAVQVSYHYQHQSNANISQHNPGTDGHTITVGLVHFTRR